MKVKDFILIIIGALQPILWWFVYNLFEPIAKAHNSEGGLTIACYFSAVIIMCGFIVPIISKETKNDQ